MLQLECTQQQRQRHRQQRRQRQRLRLRSDYDDDDDDGPVIPTPAAIIITRECHHHVRRTSAIVRLVNLLAIIVTTAAAVSSLPVIVASTLDLYRNARLGPRVVQTRYGRLQGLVLPLDHYKFLRPIEAFLGVPYATPPTDTNRYVCKL